MSPERPVHPGDDRLLDLALGLLGPEEARAERAHLASCPACAARVRESAASLAWARAQAGDRTAVLASAEFTDAVATRAPRAARRPARGRWLLLAAAFLAIAGTFVLLRPILRPAGWSRDIHALPVSEVVGLARGERGEDGADSTMRRGLDAYARGDWEGARRALAGFATTGPAEQARRIYLGSALLELGRAADAAATLSRVEPVQVTEPWRSESRWMLAQALARSGRRASADSLLRALAETPNEVGERAQQAIGRGR